MSAKVISFINLKGGVGKTTLALATGEILASEKKDYYLRTDNGQIFWPRKYKVLLIDLDGQSNLTSSALSNDEMESCWDSKKSTCHFFNSLFKRPMDLKESICERCSNVSDIRGDLHIIPSYTDLFRFEEDVMEKYEEGLAVDLTSLRGGLKKALEDEVFLFNWNNVPGSDSERLLTCLKNDHYESWVEGAEIHKSDDGKTVHIYKDEKSAEIIIDEKKGKVTVKTSTRTYDYALKAKVKREYGKLNIYGESILEKYDYIIIDCPPNLSILTTNAIIASDYYVVPVIPEKLSQMGLLLIKGRIHEIKEDTERYPYDVKIGYVGAVLNRVDITRNEHIKLAEEIITNDDFKCFDNWIGAVKPLYLVTDYDYRPDNFYYYSMSHYYKNCRRKYGEGVNRKNPSKSKLLYERGEGRTPHQIRIYERISGFVKELIRRAN